MKRQILRPAVCLVALVLAVAACGSSGGSGGSSGGSGGGASAAPAAPKSPAPTGSPLVIGTVGQFSGFAGVISKATADAVQAWAQWTNDRGGLNGHPVKVVVRDDANDPAKSLAAVKGMVENDHVIALVGTHESGLESAWQKYIDEKKIPVIGGSATAALWLTDPNFFPTSDTAVNYVVSEVNAAKIAGKKKLGMVVCAEVPACAQGLTLAGGIATKLGLQFASGLAISSSSPNYTSQCLNMRSAGVDSIILNSSGEVSERFVADCAKQNYRPQLISPGQSFLDKLLDNANYNGAYIANDSFNWFGGAPESADFLQAMKTYKSSTPLNASASAGWAAGVTFGKAAAKIGPSPTSADIYTGLYALPAKNTLGGLIPPTTYTKDKPAVSTPCGWYGVIKNGKLTAPHGAGAICVE